jgi:hypothetical protein
MRPLRHLAAAAAAAALAVLATATPAAASPPTAVVTGRVLDGRGRPVRGVHVVFTKTAFEEPRSWVDGLACALSLGLACTDWRPDTTPMSTSATTDAAGRYRLRVRLDWRVGRAGDHDFVLTAPSGVVRAQTRTVVDYERRRTTTLRDFRLWGQVASADEVNALHRRLHVDPLPASYGSASRHPTFRLLQGARTVEAWHEHTGDRTVDTRLVEAGVDGAAAEIDADLDGYEVYYRSAVRAVTGQVRPLSRGRSCYAYGRDDKPLRLRGCRFTDGRLAEHTTKKYREANGAACRDGSRCDHPGWLLVDLGKPQLVNAVVLRWCGGNFSGLGLSDLDGVIQTSPEGTVWLPFQNVQPTRDGVLVGAPTLARYVRLDLTRCTSSDAPTEVAVFAPLD